jgi:hypothetical protein
MRDWVEGLGKSRLEAIGSIEDPGRLLETTMILVDPEDLGGCLVDNKAATKETHQQEWEAINRAGETMPRQTITPARLQLGEALLPITRTLDRWLPPGVVLPQL